MPINIMGDEFIHNSGFLKCLELHDPKTLQLKFGSSSEFSEVFNKTLLEPFLMCSFLCLGFLKHLFMP